MNRWLLLATSLVVSACVGPSADYVFTNGRVYTVNENQPWAEAVAVHGNKIVYVGDAAGVDAFVGPKTEVIDLDGKMLLPGFVDGHIHAMAGGLIARGANLQIDDEAELLARIREYVESVPDEDVVIAHGWRLHMYPDPGPRKELLDDIDSERPIFLWAVDGHSAWVNSKALEMAGVDRDSPDPQPPFSYYQRDADGTPTGWVVEIPAQLEVLGRLLEVGPEYVASGVREWFPRFAAAGITTVFDAGIQGMSIEQGYDLYQQMEREGMLPFRVYGSYYWNNPDQDPLPPLRELMKNYQSDMVRVTKLKINADGGDDKHNAIYVEPYADRDDGWRGEPILPPDVVTRAVVAADAEGIDVFCHCFGDAASRMLLDAVEAAIESNPPRDRRHATSHTMLIHPDDVTRYRELGVIADFQLVWAALDPLMTTLNRQRLGTERMERQMAAKEVLNAGGIVTISSDWPVGGYSSTHEPLKTIQVAVTRQVIDEPRAEPLGGVEARLTVAEAIKAHTWTAAYGVGAEDVVGSVEVGKYADLVILEQNLFEVEPTDIADVKVVMTMMDGVFTYREEM